MEALQNNSENSNNLSSSNNRVSQNNSNSSMYSKKGSNNGNSKLKNSTIAVIAIVFISASAGFLGGSIGASSNNTRTTNSSVSVEQGRQAIEEQSNLISSLAKDVGPSVVSVSVTSQGMVQNGFFGSRQVQQQSAGTGFIISDSGYVLTNRHVISEGTSEVSLTMSDGTVLDDVTVVGTTSSSDPLDIGFLKINDTKGKKLTVAKLGDSSKSQVGDTVIAIGNALGQFQNTVTSGIISGYGRSVQASDGSGTSSESLQNLFQTDAAINQGNSGGPLINVNGEVIGVNTAVAGEGAQNIGFAIPINDAQGLIKGVLASGKLQRPYLGVRYVQLTPAIAKELNIKQEQGAFVQGSNNSSGVVADGPAAKGGLKDGDVITKVNDQPVDSTNTLSSVIGRFGVGETVDLTVIRGDKEQILQIKLGELPRQ